MNQGDAERTQQLRGADAGKLQELRGGNRPAAQDDLRPCPHRLVVAVAQIAYPGRPFAFEKDLLCMRPGAHIHVAALHGRIEEGPRGTDPSAPIYAALGITDPLLNRAVVIRIAGDPQRYGAIDEGIG